MSKPQHRTPEHRAARKSLAPVVAAGEAYCVEPVCLKDSRWIEPGTEWHVSHDMTGTVIIGPSHGVCNVTEAAIRGRAKQLGVGAGSHWSL
jgi:hypothetical protein